MFRHKQRISVSLILSLIVLSTLGVVLFCSGCNKETTSNEILLETEVYDGTIPGSYYFATFTKIDDTRIGLSATRKDYSSAVDGHTSERSSYNVISIEDYNYFKQEIDELRDGENGTLFVDLGLANKLDELSGL